VKKRKKKKLRNKFTDALGEEMASREKLNIDKLAKKNKSSPKVDLSKKVSPKPEVTTAPKVDEVAEEIPPLLIPEIPKKIEVSDKVQTDFDKRVSAEAKNKFLDEKPKRPYRKMTAGGRPAPERPTFHAKIMRERLAEVAEEKHDNVKKSSDNDADLHRKLSRAETAGAVLSVLMLVYSLTTMDKPLFFMSMSLLSHTLRPLIGALFGKHNREVQNALHGFSIVLFFGALFFLFV